MADDFERKHFLKDPVFLIDHNYLASIEEVNRQASQTCGQLEARSRL